MAALAQNRIVEAQDVFRAELTLAQAGGWLPVALSAVAGLAALQVRAARNVRPECSQQILELVLSLLQHPVANQETKDLARRLRKELETRLSFQAVEAAHRSAGEKDLDVLV